MALFGSNSGDKNFQQKTWTVLGITILCLLITGVFVYTFNVSLLLMAGVVLAVYLRGLTDKLKKWTGWKDGVCYGLAIFITLILLTALFWLTGAKVGEQVTELKKQWPEMKNKATSLIDKNPLLKETVGKYISSDSTATNQNTSNTQDSTSTAQNNASQNQSPSGNSTSANTQDAQSGGSSKTGGLSSIGQGGFKAVQSVFTSTFGFLGDLYVILFLGLFLAATPKEYVNGIVSLIPKKGRKKARDTLNQIGENLKKWFKGMTYSVLVTFALTAIGLLIIGVDLWLILAISAGLLTFIPNFGPIIALIPAVLVGLLDSPQTALYIAILYIGVQTVESNLITPFIQKKMLKVPPALLLFFQIVMGVLSAGWGVVMAVPVLVVIMTIVQELYTGKPKEEETETETDTVSE